MPPRQQQGPRIPFQPAQQAGAGPQISAHVTTIGVRRPAWGSAGRGTTVSTNHFPVTIPDQVIHHYDGEFNSFPLFSPLTPFFAHCALIVVSSWYAQFSLFQDFGRSGNALLFNVFMQSFPHPTKIYRPGSTWKS